MKKWLLAPILAIVLLVSGIPIVAVAHEPNPGPLPLTTQYSVQVITEQMGYNAWTFTYIFTNLTEASDYSDIGGLPAHFNGIDHTGLEGLFIRVPKASVVSNVVTPEPYREGGWWAYNGRWSADADYDYIGFWGNDPRAIYPIGQPVTFSFQVDNSQVGVNEVSFSTFFLDHAIRFPGENDKIFTSYTTQLTSPVIPAFDQQIEEIQDEFDNAVAGDGLEGVGQNATSAKGKLNALRNMLERAEDLIDQGNIPAAIQQLEDVYRKVDGDPKPPDLASGSEASAIAEMLQDLINNLKTA